MSVKYEIDNLDRKIIGLLMKDARMSFLEIARELKVSGGTVHGRYSKLRSAGIIKGTHIDVDFEKTGLGISCFVGLTLTSARKLREVIALLEKINEITEVHYTTGEYGLLIKVILPKIEDLYIFLAEKLQAIEFIQSTETFVILNSRYQNENILNSASDI